MPGKKLKSIQKECSLEFEEFKDQNESKYSSNKAHLNNCYSYHFNISWQKVGGWHDLCDIDNVPVLHDHNGTYDLRHEVFVNILNEFKAELYSKMYNVSLGEAIIKVETGQIDDKPLVYETYDDENKKWIKHTRRCENIEQHLNK